MSNISRLLPWLILLGCLVLAGCGGVSGVTDKVTGMFDGKDDEDDNKPLPPAELIEFEPTVEVEKVWSGRYGKGVEKLYLKLVPAPYYDRILVADRDGRMIAISKEDGSKLWQERTKKIHISGGVGAGEGLALVGTSDGLVIARSAKTKPSEVPTSARRFGYRSQREDRRRNLDCTGIERSACSAASRRRPGGRS